MAKSKPTGDKPLPPKRPLSAFFLYKEDHFAQTKKDNPDAKVTDITKIIAKNWREVDATEKSKYEKKNLEAKSNYEREMKEYEEKHGKVEKKKRKSKGSKAKKGKKGSDDDEDDDEEDEDEDEEEEAPKKGKKSKK